MLMNEFDTIVNILINGDNFKYRNKKINNLAKS